MVGTKKQNTGKAVGEEEESQREKGELPSKVGLSPETAAGDRSITDERYDDDDAEGND